MVRSKRPQWYLLILLLVVWSPGCTTWTLKHSTLSQIRSIETYRIDATLDCLATVAASPDALPAYGLIANGSTRITDTGTATSQSIWTHLARGLATNPLSLMGSHQPQGQWNVDPVASFTQLDGLRAACRWAVFGPEAAWQDLPGICSTRSRTIRRSNLVWGSLIAWRGFPPNG